MTKKEFLIGVIIPLAAAIISGVLVWFFTPDWEAAARSKGWVSSAEWQAGARRSGWVPESECPGFPVSVKIASPGDGAIMHVQRRTIYSRFVVQLSRPIREDNSTYLVVQKRGEANLYIADRLYDYTAGLLELPFQVDQPVDLTLWAIVVSDPAKPREDRKGEIYTDISQLRALRGFLCVSDSIHISLIPDN